MEFKVLKFETPWCGASKRLDEEFQKCRETVDVTRIDIEKFPELAKQYKVRATPTVIAVIGTTPIARLSGRMTAVQIDRLIRQIRSGLPPTLT